MTWVWIINCLNLSLLHTDAMSTKYSASMQIFLVIMRFNLAICDENKVIEAHSYEMLT